MMKHLLAGCLAVLVFCTLQSTPAYADSDNLDFSLVNKTGYGIKEVYVAPHSTDTKFILHYNRDTDETSADTE